MLNPMLMKIKIIFVLLAAVLSLPACVSVSVKSTNRTPGGQKIEKLLVVSEAEGQYVDYFSKMAQHISELFKKRGVTTDFFVFKQKEAFDEGVFYKEKIKTFGPCHILNVRKASLIENRDETHIEKDAKLHITLKYSTNEQVLWQSFLDVSSGGVLGFGTIEAGAGGKLTAEKIVLQLEQDRIIAHSEPKK